MYPKEVAGLVLVDPSHEDQREEFRKLDPRGLTAEQWDAQIVNPGLNCAANALRQQSQA